ncbi:MAG: fumarylacetoacetate hydrolase family protein [Tissierellia bacterium]|nr:fumarylacetoacetate hydrolase family protein [Tissierellia bacterium]
MFLLTYSYNNKESVGFLNEEKTGIIPAWIVFQGAEDLDMLGIIEKFDTIELKEIKDIIDTYKETIKLNEVKVLSPIPYPKRNVICLGKNYLDHVKEVKSLKNVNSDIPQKPIYFSKIASPAIGHEDVVNSHSHLVRQLDYEVELALIIGRKCKNVSVEEAENCIFGYTIANDISARDIQTSHGQWHKGKSFDTFCPLGPYLVHKSNISFPPKLKIQSYVNNELRQKGNTGDLIFDIPAIISDLTTGITLYPGDIILTGTPAGVGAGFNPPKYLKPGDKVDCLIEGIGTLSNTIA